MYKITTDLRRYIILFLEHWMEKCLTIVEIIYVQYTWENKV